MRTLAATSPTVAPTAVVPHLPRRIAGPLVRALADWLEAPSADRIASASGAWSAPEWAILQRLITIHGLCAHLYRSIPSDELAAVLPTWLHAWMAQQDTLNARRIDRMHGELAAILGAAAEAGIAVMPLKGALLTTMAGFDGHRRPMSDLDLLVRAQDRRALGVVLQGLGYSMQPEANPRPTHDVYLLRGDGEIVSIDEHPDNPRQVEVHTEVLRHLWSWIDFDELTEALWAGGRPSEVLGQPAIVSHPDDLFAHLALHASSDLLAGRGRLVQWLDLAQLAPLVTDPARLPHPRLGYPALRLASRALPRALAGAQIGQLEAGMPRALARWAAVVPLDGRCGLMVDGQAGPPSALSARWRRWAPSRWRLAVAYGDAPLPVALLRHGGTVIQRWRHRLRPHVLTSGED